MSRLRIILLLVLFICLSQAVTLVGIERLFVYLHTPSLLRLSLMSGLAVGLLTLLLRRRDCLSGGECLLLVVGTAGGLANLIDIWRLGAVADFVPVAPSALASPGDFLIALGFLGFLPVSLRQAHQGRGFFVLYGHWRSQLSEHLSSLIPTWMPGREGT